MQRNTNSYQEDTIKDIKYRPTNSDSVYVFSPCCGVPIHMMIHQPAIPRCTNCDREWITKNNYNLFEALKNIQYNEQKHGRLLTLPSLYYKYRHGCPPSESPYIRENLYRKRMSRQIRLQTPNAIEQQQQSPMDSNSITPYLQNNTYIPNHPLSPFSNTYTSIPPSPYPYNNNNSMPFSPISFQSQPLYQQQLIPNPQLQPQLQMQPQVQVQIQPQLQLQPEVQPQQNNRYYSYDSTDENYRERDRERERNRDNKENHDSHGYYPIRNRSNQKDRQYHPYNENNNNIEQKKNNNTTTIYNHNIKDPRLNNKEIERDEYFQDKGRDDPSLTTSKNESNFFIDKQPSTLRHQNDVISTSEKNDQKNRKKDQIEFFNNSDTNISITSKDLNRKQNGVSSLRNSSKDLKKTSTPTPQFIDQLDLNETPDTDKDDDSDNRISKKKRIIICKVCKCEFIYSSTNIQDKYKSLGYCQLECFARDVNNRDRISNNKHNNQ
jgi:hypothetical protein